MIAGWGAPSCMGVSWTAVADVALDVQLDLPICRCEQRKPDRVLREHLVPRRGIGWVEPALLLLPVSVMEYADHIDGDRNSILEGSHPAEGHHVFVVADNVVLFQREGAFRFEKGDYFFVADGQSLAV